MSNLLLWITVTASRGFRINLQYSYSYQEIICLGNFSEFSTRAPNQSVQLQFPGNNFPRELI